MASSYYDSAGKEVVDGDVAYAADLNDINTAVDTGFQLAEAAIGAVAANQSYYADLAEKWAENPEDTAVEPGKYSALHWAAKAEDESTQAAADRVQTGLDRTQTGLDRVQTGADKIATAADRVQTGLDKTATAADRVQTGLDVTASDANADRAETAAAMFPTLSAGDQGKYLQVDTPYTNGIITATIDLSSKENSLGNPASDGMALLSTASGTRSWGAVRPEITSAAPITGGFSGCDITKTGANQLTISAGSCLDSTGLVYLTTSANQTLSIPSVANTIYHIFRVKLVSDGSIEHRAYTSEAAVTSDAQVSKYRWIDFCLTDGSSNIRGCTTRGDLKIFVPFFTVATVSAGVLTAVDFTSLVPVARILEYGVVGGDTSASTSAMYDYTGTSVFDAQYAGSVSARLVEPKCKVSLSNTSVLLHSVRTRR